MVVLFNIMELGVALDNEGGVDWENYKTAQFVISNVFSELMSETAETCFCESVSYTHLEIGAGITKK